MRGHHSDGFILRYVWYMFGIKHVTAHAFPTAEERAHYQEHIVRLYNATII